MSLSKDDYLAMQIPEEPNAVFRQLKRSLPYREKTALPNVHVGQRKLLISEVDFLTEHPNVEWIIYAGAAPGAHMGMLLELFPHIRLIMIDPSPFSVITAGEDGELRTGVHGRHISNVDEIGTDPNERLFFMQQIMDDDLASSFRGLKGLCFISDIRTASGKYPTSRDILDNQEAQMRWRELMGNPVSLLKFRAQYTEDEVAIPTYGKGSTPYPEGAIMWLQPWCGKTSTETRLWLDEGPYPEGIINNFEYDSKLFAHHIQRANQPFEIQEDVPDYWCKSWDCKREVQVWQNYISKYSGNVRDLIDRATEYTSIPLRRGAGYLHYPLPYEIYRTRTR